MADGDAHGVRRTRVPRGNRNGRGRHQSAGAPDRPRRVRMWLLSDGHGDSKQPAVAWHATEPHLHRGFWLERIMTRVSSEPLTPELVRSAPFPSARLGRRGLDEGEVRAFCGRVSDELTRRLNDNIMLQEEVRRLRGRLLDRNGQPGFWPEDGQVQAVYVLSKAQQTAERYVADAQEYSRELAEDARMHRDEILREARMRASMILEEAHASASQAAIAV